MKTKTIITGCAFLLLSISVSAQNKPKKDSLLYRSDSIKIDIDTATHAKNKNYRYDTINNHWPKNSESNKKKNK